MKNCILILIVSVLFVFGCSSQPMFDVLIDENDVDYYQGRQVISRDDGHVKTMVNFERQDGNCFVYYLYVHNISEETFIVQPEQVYMEVTDFKTSDTAKDVVIYSYAVDPEQEIDAIENDMKDRKTEHTVGTATNCLFGLFSVVHDVSNDDEDADIGYDWAGNLAEEQADYEYDMDEMNASKEFWANNVLRTTTLHPDEKIGGLIYIPFTPQAQEFNLVIPAMENEHVYSFKQIKK